MAAPQPRPLDVDGIHATVTGAGPPVVLTHDGLLHGESWDAQVDDLAADHLVVTWDRRGYGRSPRPTGPFSSIDDLAAVTRAATDGPATLVGCSAGALVTMLCALEHPRIAAALVLIGPVVSGLPLTEHFADRGGRPAPAPDAAVAEQIEYWASDPWFVAADAGARERLRALLTAHPQNLHPPMELERPPEPALPRLGEITVPTLVAVGEHDIPDVHAHSGAITAAVPGATRIVLPGSGHYPQLETPGAVNRLLRDFLRSVPGAR